MLDDLIRRLRNLEQAPTSVMARDESLVLRTETLELQVAEASRQRHHLQVEVARINGVESRVSGLETRLDEAARLEERLQVTEQRIDRQLEQMRQLVTQVQAASVDLMQHLDSSGRVVSKRLVVRDGNGVITGVVEVTP